MLLYLFVSIHKLLQDMFGEFGWVDLLKLTFFTRLVLVVVVVVDLLEKSLYFPLNSSMGVIHVATS